MRTGTVRDRLAQTQGVGQQQPQPPQAALPQYVVDRREKLRSFSEAAARGPHHSLATSVAKLQGTETSMRLCGDLIEGAVLALGVQTTHRLLSSLNEAREDIHRVEALWRECTQANAEEVRLRSEFIESLINSHNALRERSEAAEKEIRRLSEEMHRKEASADHAIQYIHSVIAERAVWQERHGHNPLDLPVEAKPFAERAVAALESLQQVRPLRLDDVPPLEGRLSWGGQTTTPARPPPQAPSGALSVTPASRSGSTLPPTLPAPRTSNANDTTNIPNGKRSDLPFSSPLATCTPPSLAALSPQDAMLLARIRSLENTRHSTIAPSSRLHYIPPSEEVELLREVLAMGTGSTTLMADIAAARSSLERHKARLRGECTAMRGTMASVRQEVDGLRHYIQSLLSQGMPFLTMKEDLLQPLNCRIEHDAREMAQLWVADMAIDINAVANNGRYATTKLDQICGAAGTRDGEGSIRADGSNEASSTTSAVAPGDSAAAVGVAAAALLP